MGEARRAGAAGGHHVNYGLSLQISENPHKDFEQRSAGLL